MNQGALPKTSLDFWINRKIGVCVGPLTRQALTGYQLQKLEETIDLAYERSPFYRNHLKGLTEQRLTCLEDLTRLPFTTPMDIQDQGLQMLCVSQGEISRVVTLDSSGTTGKPKRLYFTSDDQELTIDFYTQVLSAFVGPGDRVFILFPSDRPGSIGRLLEKALARLGAIPIQHGIVNKVQETLKKLAETRADLLIGIPIQALALARFDELSGNGAQSALRRMILTTDYVSRAIITEINRIWQCEVFDHYGMTEMGLGGGIECSAHSGYHLREADLYVEIVHPQTGASLPEGQTGEVVFTTLTRRGMPLVRYRTGDLSRFLPGECPCGAILRRMDYIKARRAGMVAIDDGDYLTMADLDEKLLTLPGVLDFSALISRQSLPATLKIQMMALGRTVTEQEVRDALDSIPALRSAQGRGKLELFVESILCNSEYQPGVGKRRISVI